MTRRKGGAEPPRKLGRGRPTTPTTPISPETRRAPGRPPGPMVEVTERDRDQAEALSGYGLTDNSIADVLGISRRTFYRRKIDDPELSAALQRGKGVAEARVGKALFDLCVGAQVLRAQKNAATGQVTEERYYTRSPDITAIRWWETTRLGRRDLSERRLVGDPSQPVAVEDVSQLTPAMKVARFRALLTEARRAQGLDSAAGNAGLTLVGSARGC